jgi:fructose-1,6-bisphosphatase/inositol monophosphatase family enzyme
VQNAVAWKVNRANRLFSQIRFDGLALSASEAGNFRQTGVVVLSRAPMSSVRYEQARRLICALHLAIREKLIAARARDGRKFAKVAGVTSADTIYYVDRLSEEVILGWFEAHWPRSWPVEIVMEGLAEGTTTFPRGVAARATIFKCIIDPIDGTRGLMYDKRSAWVLTGLAPQRGARTTLADIEIAVMTELPTSKQWRADQLSAIRGGGASGVVARATDVRGGGTKRFVPRLSTATDFGHGFASLARFFPQGKSLIAKIEEELWSELNGDGANAPLIFDDQYISTGGQIYEILAGHDRMLGDIRPRAFAKLGIASSLTCHPYDICTELILREAGGVVETIEGKPLRDPLDTTSPVTWMGYANEQLARQVRPVLRRLVRKFL